MEIYGSRGSTGIIQLNNEEASHEPLFYRGSSVEIILNVHKPLGFIQAVRIGHDNSGIRPSWFLEDVVILDKQTSNSWTYSNNQWLALERDDGKIERVLETSTYDFNREVFKLWCKGLRESHVWVSVYTKPPRQTFSRVQRASCCLSILLSAMFANAMFYVFNEKSLQVIQVGPLRYSWKQVIAGIQSIVFVTLINIFIIFLFEKGSSRLSSRRSHASSKHRRLVYVAWFLCFCTCAVSVTFTIFYSISWEKTVAQQWLSSMVISMVQTVTVIEPIRVFFTAVILAVMKRRKRGRPDECSTLEETPQLSPKESLWKLEISKVEGMRKRQAKKLKISRFFVELFVYSMFVFILMVVCYGNKDYHRYLLTKSVSDGLAGFHKVCERMHIPVIICYCF